MTDIKISVADFDPETIKNPLCSLFNATTATTTRTEAMSTLNTLGTYRTQGDAESGVGIALDQLLIPVQEESDWTRDFLTAVRPTTDHPWSSSDESETTTTTKTTTAASSSLTLKKMSLPFQSTSVLNTPTLELAANPLVQQIANITATTAEDMSHDVILADMEVDVVPSTSTAHLPQTIAEEEPNFEDIWTFGGSPTYGTGVYRGVPLSAIQGHPDHLDEGFESQPFFEDNTPFLDGANPFAVETAPFIDIDTAAGNATGAVVEVKTEVVETAGENSVDGTDLLNWLVNDTIHVSSGIPGDFGMEEEEEECVLSPPSTVDTSQLFITPPTNVDRFPCSPSTSTASSSTAEPARTSLKRSRNYSSDNSLTSAPGIVKRGRGRPPRPPGRLITPPVRQRRVVSSAEESSDFEYVTTDGNLSDADIKLLKYRRMRDLNNEASKRCRENRKMKNVGQEEELDVLKRRNTELRRRLRKLEAQVRRVKEYYQQHIVLGNGADMPGDITVLWSTLNNSLDQEF